MRGAADGGTGGGTRPRTGTDEGAGAVPARSARRAASATVTRLEQVFRTTGVAMGLVALDGAWLAVTDRLCELLRTDAATLLALTPRDLIHPDDRPAAVRATRELLEGRVESVDARRRYVGGDGRVVEARVSTTLLRDPDGRPDSFLTQLFEAGAPPVAGQEPVTGLAGRETLLAHVGRALGRSRRAGRTVLLVHVDMPEPADGLPSPVEDRLLACAAQRLVGAVRAGDLVAAVPGRRLTVCCEGLGAEEDVPTVVARVRGTLEAPVEVDGVRYRLRPTLSAAVAARSDSAEELLQRDGWPVTAPLAVPPSVAADAGTASLAVPPRAGRHRAPSVL